MEPTPTRALQPGEVRRYVARVKDVEGNHPIHGDDWWRVTTETNPKGEFAMRSTAEEVLARAIAGYRHGKLMGHVTDIVVRQELTLDTVRINDWLRGDVVAIRDVPEKFRDDYRNTLQRAALAASRYGHPVWVNDSFRTRAEQQARWDSYLRGGPLAAYPGTSDHERGLSLDIPNARNIPALIRELRKLNMIDDVASEVWHVTNMARK